MDRYPHSDFDSATSKLPPHYKSAPVKEGAPQVGRQGFITGYSYDRLLNTIIYLQPWNTRLAIDHVQRLTLKQRLDSGVQRFTFLSKRIRDGYNLIPGLRIVDRPEQLIVLPSSVHIRNGLVNFAVVDNVVKNASGKTKIKPHPDTAPDILAALNNKFQDLVLPKDDMLYPYVRACKKVWITSQSEVGVAAPFLDKPFSLIDNAEYAGPIPSLYSLYKGIANSPVRITTKEKMVRCLSHPESGLIAVGTGEEEQDIMKFFTQYVLHRHAGE
jgi:hypothetical protein